AGEDVQAHQRWHDLRALGQDLCSQCRGNLAHQNVSRIEPTKAAEVNVGAVNWNVYDSSGGMLVHSRTVNCPERSAPSRYAVPFAVCTVSVDPAGMTVVDTMRLPVSTFVIVKPSGAGPRTLNVGKASAS